MDTLTHALSGALLARASAPYAPRPGALAPRARLAAGFAAAAFPDCDFALRLVDTLTYLNWHQGITHSLLLMPVWAWLLAHAFSWMTRRRHSWQAFVAPVFLGIAVHVLQDVFTAYGTMLFAPLSTQRFSVPLAFVVDPYLTVIVASAVALSLLRPQSRSPAVIGLAAFAGYMGLLTALHGRALDIGSQYAATQRLADARVHALAQPLTPFNRKIIVRHGDGYHEAHVNLWRARPFPPQAEAGLLARIAAGYRPASAPAWQRLPRFGETRSETALAHAAWHHDVLADFRRFAVFPALDRIDVAAGETCVWFYDLRFSLPALPPSFRYGACRNATTSDWRLARARGAFWID